VQNVLRIATVNFIGDILLFLGKLIVAAGCGLIAFGMAELPYYSGCPAGCLGCCTRCGPRG
jgi:choline transporter-like protein 2/4/5